MGDLIATDDEVSLRILRQPVPAPRIFSAGLPHQQRRHRMVLDLLDETPGRVTHLGIYPQGTSQGYQEIGSSPGIPRPPSFPFTSGQNKAFAFAKDMFDHGVLALPAIYPAVPGTGGNSHRLYEHP